jgi:hypothetical protein
LNCQPAGVEYHDAMLKCCVASAAGVLRSSGAASGNFRLGVSGHMRYTQRQIARVRDEVGVMGTTADGMLVLGQAPTLTRCILVYLLCQYLPKLFW